MVKFNPLHVEADFYPHMRPEVFCELFVVALKHRISNIEQGTAELRRGSTSTFDIPCSIFCGSEKVPMKPIVTILTVLSVSKSQPQGVGGF